MGRREGVIDENVAERRKLSGKAFVVLFFLGVKARILQTENVAVLHLRDGRFRRRTHAVLGEGDGLFHDPRHLGGDRPQRSFRIGSFGTAEMREQNDFAALAGEFGNGRSDFFDAGRVGDLPVEHRHVEVDAQQYAFALHVGVVEVAKAHGGGIRRQSN